MSFRSELHPRGHGGKFISAGAHRDLSSSHASRASSLRAGGSSKSAGRHEALASVHAHAAKRIESGRSGRLGSSRPGKKHVVGTHVQTDGGKSISRADAAAVMFGRGSPQHKAAIAKLTPKPSRAKGPKTVTGKRLTTSRKSPNLVAAQRAFKKSKNAKFGN